MKKLLIVIGAIIIAVLLWGAKSKPEPILWQEYTVSAGDTLWSIANEITPDISDCRRTVKYIADENGIIDSMIFPGQELLVPIWEVR